jgi:S1-C subfamily serine protease
MAGLRSGDWIVAVDGQTTATVDDLHRRLAGITLGVSLKVAVIRGSATLDALVTPSEAL